MNPDVPWVREKHDGCDICAKGIPTAGHEHVIYLVRCNWCRWEFGSIYAQRRLEALTAHLQQHDVGEGLYVAREP